MPNALFSPITETLRGLRAFPAGLNWLRAHPRYLAYLSLPSAGGLAFLVATFGAFAQYQDRIFALILFARPETWAMLALWYVCKFFLYFASAILIFVAAILLVSVVASPIYDVVSTAVERDVTGREPQKLTLAQHASVMLGELQKVLLILSVSTLLLFIPGINVISALVTAFLVGWDLFDYPLARRGWSFRERVRFVAGEGWAVLGFGLWLVIPFVQFLLVPLAVAGGTLLNLQSLEKRRRLP